MTDPTARLNEALAGRYRVERVLGTGGMATVYLAHDLRHDRPVAVKILRPDLAAVIGVERFLAEIKTTAQLQHAHILGLIDSGEVNGTVFYVMPFVDGESLRDRLRREKQIPIPDAVRIATAVAGALDYAHRRGVIHRDIKPENIMLHEGQPLVADFGIALAVTRSDTSSRITESGMSLGTPHYMSPEQAMGERTLDARTDVYSLGCVLYEMLTGEPPFNGPTAQAIIAKVMTVEPEPVTTLRRSVPANVAAATMTALNKVPADRFANTSEFSAALANPRYVTAETSARRAASRVPTLSGRELVAAALVVLFAVAAVAGWLRRAAPANHVAWLAIDEMPGTDQVHLSRDGTRLLWSAGNAYWERRLDTLGARRLRDAIPQTQFRDVSPDGRDALISGRGGVAIVPLGSGPARELTAGAGGRGGRAAWGSDEYIYASFGSPGDRVRGIVRIPARGGAVDTLTNIGENGFINEIVPIPGGRGLIVVRSYGGGVDSIAAFDIGARTWTTLAAGGPQVRFVESGYLLFASGQYIMAAPLDVKGLAFTQSPIPFVALNTGVATLSAGADVLVYRAAADPQGDVGIEVRGINGTTTQLPNTAPGTRFAGLSVSPDGKRFVATGTPAPTPGSPGPTQIVSNLYVYTLPTGPMQQLLSPLRDGSPAWIPGTRDLAFVRFEMRDTVDTSGSRRQIEMSTLMRRPWDGSAAPTTILARRWDADSAPKQLGANSWFENGARAIVQVGGPGGGRGGGRGPPPSGGPGGGPRGGGAPPAAQGGGRGGSSELMMWSRAAPDSLRPVFGSTPFTAANPAVSADGRLLAYTSNVGNRAEVHVSRLDGSARLQVSLNGGSLPKWARTGNELFFRSANSDTLFATRIQSGADLTAGSLRTVLAGASLSGGYGILPGDTLFVLRPPAPETHRPFVVVLNVTQELKRRLSRQ